ncbi:hypothetical protein [Nocardioides bizhenqiangii]|uniref:DUF4129 domain-containing protein n=1 Tax=Nocardioides bizhenqiangii TaxID=3095076 RepID=A0ABZ0ZUC4_9ACTN|nr:MULTISPECIES: hypothetical protein [unclassified Nocardioides]MDZ5621898.1 hypothetical protein [Nocardioides sp. HM23]WQQ27419.1 hypothetical protein SHK19_04125 [Nocardioides sp. HM61]
MLADVELHALELQDEFNGPVAYGDRWLWLALLGLCLVAVYYLAVVWFTRDRSVRGVVSWTRADVPSVRQQHLDRIARIEAAVRTGQVPARDGHQQLSETVRSYVGAVSTIPAPTMTLADFRHQAPPALTEAIELMYPPEFAPDEVGQARERFDDALARARQLVASWS